MTARQSAWATRWRFIVVSWDLAIGVGVALAVFFASSSRPKLRQPHLLDVGAGISVAVLAVVIASLAIVATFMDEEYRLFIKTVLGSARRAYEPYEVVAAVAGAAALVSVAGLFVWPIARGWVQSLLMALSLGPTAWAVVGTVQLVRITAMQGYHRSRVGDIHAAYLRTREEKKAPQSGGDT
jgi:uncharacterized membrane protein